ncbi:TetR family transcriptional regulator [Duganella sp. FT80W]|uniref:TetR family transcriptional regulator n=1 Tax=Duganella guangzhouensis TaxID=2666084 RepID=A0A6I2L8D1_9BURK|nr:TetR/AcrR family transcriptional regulator [Duganella guangzhouensis]MRW93942.1 TetR family transcriptional regulator [Duganella guangzhouensis]
MAKNTASSPRREQSLTRERIIEESIALLDSSGESGLTFRALAERLATGAGAIYWHIANKNDLLATACAEMVTRALQATAQQASPQDSIRAVALGLFDTIDAHPWVGSALTRAPLQSPTVHILEKLGQQVRAMGVPPQRQFAVVSALLSYILGVSVQNAANAQIGRALGGDRAALLDEVAGAWEQLDAGQFPFTRDMGAQLRAHDDRADFLAGVDLILSGIVSAPL